VVRDAKAAKRPYSPPSFQLVDASTAKAELKAKGASKDVKVREMLSLIDKQLEEKGSRLQSASRDPLP